MLYEENDHDQAGCFCGVFFDTYNFRSHNLSVPPQPPLLISQRTHTEPSASVVLIQHRQKDNENRKHLRETYVRVTR